MRKLMIAAVILSVLGLSVTLTGSSPANYQGDSLQIAGDDGPNGG